VHVAVVGAGSLGSLVGGLLARTHEVTLVGRPEGVRAVRESGLRVTGAVETTVHPAARTDPPPAADLAVLAVKSFDTAGAAADLAGTDLGAALSLQNGMGNEATLADHLEAPVLAGTTTYGADLVEPGVVRCNGVGEVALGPREGGRSETADRVGAAFRAAGVETTVSGEMPRRLWEKLAVNAGINATTALARVDNGALLDGPAGDPAREAARETARVASEAGVALTPEGAVTALERVADETATNVSSTRQDVRAGRRTEVDAINGYVVERATQPAPVNETLAGLLRAWESGRGLR